MLNTSVYFNPSTETTREQKKTQNSTKFQCSSSDIISFERVSCYTGVRNGHGNQIPGKKLFFLVWGHFAFWKQCVTFSRHHTCAQAHTQSMQLAKFSCSSVTTMITKFSSDHNVFEYKWFLFPGSA